MCGGIYRGRERDERDERERARSGGVVMIGEMIAEMGSEILRGQGR